MVLYHRDIPCVVLVDLKIGRLSAQEIGQINKYLGYWRRHKQYAHEQPAIGLIICREAGREEVIYADGCQLTDRPELKDFGIGVSHAVKSIKTRLSKREQIQAKFGPPLFTIQALTRGFSRHWVGPH